MTVSTHVAPHARALSLAVAIVLAALGGCAGTGHLEVNRRSALDDAYRARDVVRVERATRTMTTSAALAYRAWALAAVGQSDAASAVGSAALADPDLPDSLAALVQTARISAAVRAGTYAVADQATREALADPRIRSDSARWAEIANDGALWAALAAVSPPVATGAGEAPAVPDKAGLLRVPLRVGEADASFVFDTGANLSTLTRTEAARLGLAVRETAASVTGVTGTRVPVGIAVADRVEIAGVSVGPVPFLVLPDSALAFPQIGYAIEGIVGLPVIAALGAVDLPLAAGILRAGTGGAPGEPLAFDGLTLLVRVPVQFPGGMRDTVSCAVDTGAPETSLHATVYRRHRALVDSRGRATEVGVAGAGGARRIPAVVLPDVQFEWPGHTVGLVDVPVYTTLADGEGDCRLGLDALSGAHALRIDVGRLMLAPVWESRQ